MEETKEMEEVGEVREGLRVRGRKERYLLFSTTKANSFPHSHKVFY